jgi:hypothetical protein
MGRDLGGRLTSDFAACSSTTLFFLYTLLVLTFTGGFGIFPFTAVAPFGRFDGIAVIRHGCVIPAGVYGGVVVVCGGGVVVRDGGSGGGGGGGGCGGCGCVVGGHFESLGEDTMIVNCGEGMMK